MSCRGSVRVRAGRRAFTLLEVTIAVVIISFLMFAVYRFVRSNIMAIGFATRNAAERESVAALLNYVRGQLEDLPVRGQGTLLGNPGTIRDMASDEMQWICRAGPGVLTTSGADEYRVTLALQPVSARGSELEIGLRRQPTNVDTKDYQWVSLMRPAAGLEIRYYDPRLNAWIERWSDTNLRPALVRMRVWRTANEMPLEAVLAVPAAKSQGLMLQ